MTAKFFAILTNQGAARLANATALGTKLNLTQLAVGDGGGALPTPDPAQTALLGEKRRAALNLLSVDPTNSSQIIAEQIIPENEGGFWIREIGLYDDAGVLIAVANCPETYKPKLQEGSGRTQTIRMVLIVSSTAAVTLKIDPSVVLATRKYVDDRIIEVKLYADNLLTQHVAAVDPHSQYAQKNSPALTGRPTAPTAPQTENSTQLATTGFVKAALSALVASSPAALDTLKELADALGNDANFSTTVMNALAAKQPLDATLTALAGKDVAGLLAYLGLTTALNNKQPLDATLTALAGLANSANKLPYFTATDTMAVADLSAFVRAMLGKADAAAVLSYLGLKTAAQRDVGTAANQIPDMSSFTSGTGWCRYPDGTIFQYGTAGFQPGVNNQFVNLPRAFTTTTFRVICTWSDVGPNQGTPDMQAAANLGLGAGSKSTTRFGLWQGGPGGFNVDYIAIGR